MNYCEIKKCDIANGPGVRVTLFVAGCRRHCPGCFNPDTWDFAAGQEYTQATQEEILEALAPSYIAGLTLLGGEPMERENQPAVYGLVRQVRERYPEKTIWCYTGCTLERDFPEGGAYHTGYTDALLRGIDILVDGEFREAQKDLRLRFRGSANQRILDLPRTLREGRPVTAELKYARGL